MEDYVHPHRREGDPHEFHHTRTSDAIVAEIQREHIDFKYTLQGINGALAQTTETLKSVSELANKTDDALRGWIKYFQGAAFVFGVVIVIGGYILVEKNAQLIKMQDAMLTNQTAILANNHDIRLSSARQDAQAAELRRQAETDSKIFELLLDVMKKDASKKP